MTYFLVYGERKHPLTLIRAVKGCLVVFGIVGYML